MKLTVITTKAPYGASDALEAMEAAIAATNTGAEVNLVFMGDGVLQLLRHQSPEGIMQKSIAKKLALLPLIDIDKLYAAQIDADALNILPDQLVPNVVMLSPCAINDLLLSSQHVLRF